MGIFKKAAKQARAKRSSQVKENCHGIVAKIISYKKYLKKKLVAFVFLGWAHLLDGYKEITEQLRRW